MTAIETQLCDILGLTDPAELAKRVKSLHDRYGDEVWPGRGPIPCFCGEINVVTRQKLGARPDEPVFSAADRIVRERDRAVRERDRLVEECNGLRQERDELLARTQELKTIIRHTRVALGGPDHAMPLPERAAFVREALTNIWKERDELANSK